MEGRTLSHYSILRKIEAGGMGEVYETVAVGSVFARAEFLRRLQRIEKEYGMEFPRGASTAVETKTREFVEKYEADPLPEVAKMHLRTTRIVLELLRVPETEPET